jgi:hypothetical protein
MRRIINGFLIDGCLIDGCLIDGCLIDGCLINICLIDGCLINGRLIYRNALNCIQIIDLSNEIGNKIRLSSELNLFLMQFNSISW